MTAGTGAQNPTNPSLFSLNSCKVYLRTLLETHPSDFPSPTPILFLVCLSLVCLFSCWVGLLSSFTLKLHTYSHLRTSTHLSSVLKVWLTPIHYLSLHGTAWLPNSPGYTCYALWFLFCVWTHCLFCPADHPFRHLFMPLKKTVLWQINLWSFEPWWQMPGGTSQHFGQFSCRGWVSVCRKNSCTSPIPSPSFSMLPGHSMPSSAPVTAEQPLHVGRARLTPEERHCRIGAGECLYCGQHSHFILGCPVCSKD